MPVFIICILYITVTLAVGIVISRRNKNSGDFFVAKERLNLPLCCVLLLASSFAGAFTTGAAQDSYVGGFAPYLPMVSMGMGYILFLSLVPFYRCASKEGAISIPEVFSLRFDRRCGAASMVINCITYCVLFSVQPVAFARTVAPMLNLDPKPVAWGAAVIMMVMALCGLTGVAWMNIVHCLVMVGGLSLVSIVSICRAGGINNIVATVPQSMWNVLAPNTSTAIMRFVALTFCYFPQSECATIAMSAKNVKTAKKALLIIGVFIFVFSALLMMIGISAHVVIGDDLENTGSTLYVLSAKLGPVFNLIASVAVLAAITSSAPAYLIYFSTNVTRQLTKNMPEEKVEQRSKLISSICIVVTALIGTFFAQKATSILDVLFNVFEILTVCGIVLVFGVFWKRVSARSAFWTIAITAVITTIWLILGCPFGIIPGWISTILGTVLIIVFTLCEKEPTSADFLRMQAVIEKHKNED